jgi:mannose-6-phosphate isomerase-like protein (cupin superfamily)
MRIRLNENDSNVIKQNDTYTLVDNTELNNLVVSKTILHPQKNTTGHDHPGQEEVYHFISGEGYMKLGDETIMVREGSIVLIPDGVFHKVWNTSTIEDLVFVCVFDGKRNH